MNKLIEIHSVQAIPIKTMIEALKDILVDINIEISEEGLKIMEIDATQSILVHIFLEASKFQYFKIKKRMIIGLSVINFFKLIKTINNGDILQLYIEENKEYVLSICIENSDKNYQTKYEMNLLDIDYNKYDCPDKEFDTQIILPSQYLQKICRDMGNLSDIVEVKSIQKKLIFECQGDFAKQQTVFTEVENKEDNIVFKKNNNDVIIQGYYSLKHLISLTKCTNLCQSLEIYIDNNYPLIIVYNIGNMGKLKLCLSPKEINT